MGPLKSGRQAGNSSDKNVGFGAQMLVQSPDKFRVWWAGGVIFGDF